MTVAVCGVPDVAAMEAAAPEVLVRAKVADGAPAALAITLYEPMVEFAVAVTLAIPEALVAAVAAESAALAPVAGAAKVTVTPLTGLFPASRTVTRSGVVKVVLNTADCGVPPLANTVEAAPAVLVNENGVTTATPGTEAVMLKTPAVLLAVAVTLAMPEAFVATVAADNAALAPETGAANDTAAPGTGLPCASLTVTCSAAGNAVLIGPVCGVPPVATIDAAGPGVLESAKATGTATPPALALMV